MLEAELDLWVAGTEALCITTNGSLTKTGRGVMGRGVAAQAARRYKRLDLPSRLGQMLVTAGNHVGIMSTPAMRPELVVFPVKHQWREPADPMLIVRSAHELVALTDARKWTRVALPRPGCGNGHLAWKDVRPLLVDILDDRFIVVHVP